MNNKILGFFLFFLLFFFPLAAVKAADAQVGDSVYVTKEQIISGNLYTAGQTVTVDGTISGDLIALAQNVTVNGSVGGDVIVLAQNVTVNGSVGGNIRIAGNNLTINGTVIRNVNAFGASIILGANSHVGWDVYLAGQNIETRGIIDGDLSGQAGQILIAGKIGKSINLKLSNKESSQKLLVIAPEAVISGDVIYTSKNLADISSKASIAGKVQQNNPPINKIDWWIVWLWGEIFAIFSALVVGLVLIFIGKNISTKILSNMAESPVKLLLPGLILMLVLPPLALILVFTMIGLSLALIITAWWLVMIYVAKILTAILVGQTIIKILNKKGKSSLFWSLILGVTICWLIFSIPLVGWLISLVAICLGLGGIWTYATYQLKHL
ncbi:MAG: polymer-forming cytoskeletal protein [Patescibacteria group bacterium]|jgi:cytoskeletal protein CcmA (bactofilin family)